MAAAAGGDEALPNQRVHVHVAGKEIVVCCGGGDQRVKWLAHVGIARWDPQQNQGWVSLGVPTAVTKQDGSEIDMTAVVKDVIADGEHVTVLTSLSGDEEALGGAPAPVAGTAAVGVSG